MPADQALVLGGGGVAGIAWITGLLAGLADAGQDVTKADLLVGTSAGAAVAAQVGSGLSLDALFARQTEPALQSREISVEVDMQKFAAEFGALLTGATSAQDVHRRAGAYALAAQTVSEAERLAVVGSRLPSPEWPARRLLLVAVDAETGETRVFDRQSGVDLVDAVAASCAVPGIWPPVTIGGHRYVDGGVRSSDNADLAAGHARIVVVSPLGPDSPIPSRMPLRTVVSQLRSEGSAVTVIAPDEASVAAIGTNPLDPATRIPAAQAGRAQGRAGLRETGSLGKATKYIVSGVFHVFSNRDAGCSLHCCLGLGGTLGGRPKASGGGFTTVRAFRIHIDAKLSAMVCHLVHPGVGGR